MKVVPGIASQQFGAQLAKKLGIELLEIEHKVFPDNEQYLRLKEETNEKVIITQSISSDRDFVALLLLLDALKGTEIIVIIPYFGYARQDKKFKEGEPISARAIIESIDGKAKEVITFDVHNEEIKRFFDETKFKNLTAFKEIAKEFEKDKDRIIIAPDEGAIDYAKTLAKELKAPYDYLEKTRKNEKEIEIANKELDVANKEVILVDDIVSTGGTMSKAIKELKKQGAKKINIAVTHPVFAQTAIQKIYSAGADEIISTNTIEKSFSKIDVSNIVSEEIELN